MVAVPSYVSSAAKRGLDLLEYRGDGLKEATVREARTMASGTVTPDKVRRMAAWFARHEGDLNSPDARAYLNGDKERPTAGQVAWLLWGGSLGNDRLDAMRWAERKRDQLIAEGELSKASPGDIREGTTVQFAVPKPPDPTYYTTGIVEAVVTDGTVRIGNETLEATEEDPVARIRVYAILEDEQFERTDRVVPKHASELRVIDSIESRIKKAVPAAVRETLSNKVEEHNKKYGGAASRRVTVPMLAQVFERGIGAYKTNPGSVRPNVTSAEQWAYGRVNAFLTAVRTGDFPRGSFDTDLLPSGHPLSSRKANKASDDMGVPEAGATLKVMPLTDTSSAPQLSAALNELLANVVVFYFSAHRAHWNVTGPDFLEYHDLFANIYEDTYGSIDPFAENLRKLGSFPEPLPLLVTSASMTDATQTSSASELAADLYGKNNLLVRMLKAAFIIADDANEQGIANFIAERIDSHEKWDWQLRSSLSA